MEAGKLSTFLKSGAIWGFIVLELVFFSIAGEFLSLSDKAFMDWENMLLLLKQSAPIGIIAMGMTIVMINGNIDLSVGATYAIAAIVMFEVMSASGLESIGDWVIPLGWLAALAVGTGLGALNGLIVWKTGVDAFIVTLGSMLGFRGLVFMYNGEHHGPRRNARNEVRRAINRINDPGKPRRRRLVVVFFSDHAIVRKCCVDQVADVLFNGTVRIRHKVLRSLVLNIQRFQPAEVLKRQSATNPRDFHCRLAAIIHERLPITCSRNLADLAHPVYNLCVNI